MTRKSSSALPGDRRVRRTQATLQRARQQAAQGSAGETDTLIELLGVAGPLT